MCFHRLPNQLVAPRPATRDKAPEPAGDSIINIYYVAIYSN